LLKDDGMGFSFHITTIYAGTETPMHYQNHLESVYCISGEGEVETVADGKVYPLKAGSIYVLDKNDKHILRARTELKTACVFNGFVSMAPGTRFSSTEEVGFGVQDDTGGLYVSVTALLNLPQNAAVEVVGDLINVSSELVLFSNYTGVKRLDGDKVVEPEVIKTGDLGESFEGRLVRLTGMVTKAVVDEKPFGVRSFIDDGSGEVQIYINLVNDISLIDTDKLVPGTMVQITGFVGQFDSTYEIYPRRGLDLVVP
jgi:hypothetical protein